MVEPLALSFSSNWCSKLSLPPQPSQKVLDSCQAFFGRPLKVQDFKVSSHKFRTIFTHAAIQTANYTELDAITKFSEIVPDTIIFDDFERLAPTAATVSSSLLLGITSVPKTKFNNAIETALAYNDCYLKDTIESRLSCFTDKALVNVGSILTKLVPGRVSTELDARLAYDTAGTVAKVHDLIRLYEEVEVPKERVLFKIPATWQGIEAARLLEAEGIQTHMTFVYCFPQAAAAAQAGASVMQIFMGRLRDWARNNSGDKEIQEAVRRGEDPGISLVRKAYNYVHKNGYKAKLMAAAVRNKQDLFSILGVDYIITPVKIVQSLQESEALPDDKYSFARCLNPTDAEVFPFTENELVTWDQKMFAERLTPAAEDLLAKGLESYLSNTKRLEEYFAKIWPPPNV
ncbi:hypothetical protein KP509_29G020100 [Ceratopteris richardii]|uniref:transaldolase n=1 Tax=Ceratopteris richardii TaxID=49495 RepID=A0A8T2R5A9_CERRI|nr:hypothetical protein KP509_29G020100 [Ceratopteris richardii]KAH7291517.1 hypothetical protein KP509_29G020100 [Ceratopteris richardii]